MKSSMFSQAPVFGNSITEFGGMVLDRGQIGYNNTTTNNNNDAVTCAAGGDKSLQSVSHYDQASYHHQRGRYRHLVPTYRLPSRLLPVPPARPPSTPPRPFCSQAACEGRAQPPQRSGTRTAQTPGVQHVKMTKQTGKKNDKKRPT